MPCAARSRCRRRWLTAPPRYAEDRRIAFRIGINIGDIIVEGDDIFGDGVNVAARLQEIAAPGGICISSRVHEDVRDRLDTAFDDGGTQTLKNIARPVQVWRWQPGTAVAAEASARADSTPATRQAVDRRAAVPEHERRSGAGVLRRRRRRGHHHGAVALQVAVRHRPQFELHLQGQSRRTSARSVANLAYAMCLKEACARRATGCASRRS